MRFLGMFSTIVVSLCLAAEAENHVFLGHRADPVEERAAEDFQRYVYGVTGQVWEIRRVDRVPPGATGVVLGTPQSIPETPAGPWPFGLQPPRYDGYILLTTDGGNLLIVAGPSPAAVRNGVYGFLDESGFSFYLSDDTFPAAAPDSLARRFPARREVHSPAVGQRGTVVRDTYLAGPAAWSFPDWRQYIDQLAKLRLNTLVVYAAEDGPLLSGRMAELPTSGPDPWFNQPLDTDRFLAGTGIYFDGAGLAGPDTDGRRVLRRALDYAKARGLTVGVGFDVSRGDPTDPEVQAAFDRRIRDLLTHYPSLDQLWLWAPEQAALRWPGEPPAASPWAAYVRRWQEELDYLPDPGRRAEPVRLALFAIQARQTLGALRPDVQVVAGGWGGDESLRFAEFLPGLDRILPADIAFGPLQELPPGPKPLEQVARLSPDRARMPVLWLEYDGDLWMPQPSLHHLVSAVGEALQQGAQGLLGIHWRIPEADEAAAFLARLAWDPGLTVEAFLLERATDLYGPGLAADLAPYHARLDELGYRWVGGLGQSQPAPFVWDRGAEARRAQLIRAASDLRTRLGREGIEPSIIPDVTQPLEFGIGLLQMPIEVGRGLVERPLRTGRRLLRAPLDAGRDLAGTVLPLEPTLPAWHPALEDLYARIRFVLAFDAAAAAMAPGGAFDTAAAGGRGAAALRAVEEARLAELIDLHAQRVGTKTELGVLAELNTKAWANVRARLREAGAQTASLESLPATYRANPQMRVLPDRVLVVGAADAEVSVKARPLGNREFLTHGLQRTGRATYLLEFPADAGRWRNFQYGVEARLRDGKTLKWPPGFPQATRLAHGGEVGERAPIPAADSVPVATPDVKYQAFPDRRLVRLTWTARPGEGYTVFAGDETPVTVYDGWYEGALTHGAPKDIRVEAQSLASGVRAVARVQVPAHTGGAPEAPARVRIVSRGGWNILSWASDDPGVREYVVAKYGADHRITREYRVDADPGHILRFADPATAGQAAAYSVAAVGIDGHAGPATRPMGILARPGTVQPVVHLRADNEAALLANLAQVGANALALGGAGWSDLPRQPDWDPSRSITLALRLRLDETFGMPVLVCKGPWQDPAYYLQVFDEGLRFHLAGIGTLDAGTLRQGVWHHVAATFEEGEMRLYIDGRQVGRKRADAQRPRSLTAPVAARYGERGEPAFVHGVLDDIRVYEIALAPEELQVLAAGTE